MINGPVWDEKQLDGVSPTILAVGDSWFWYPINNLANPLYKILNRGREHVILVRGHNGAATSEYVSGPIRKQIEWDLDKKIGYGRTIQAVFISGGGNDFAGRDDMESILKDNCQSAQTEDQCFRRGQPVRLMSNAVANLVDVASLVAAKLPDIPVFIHGYDYANPNGKGFLGLGQWLQYPMDEVKVARELQQRIVNLLLNTFAKQLSDAAATSQNIRVVDMLGTLTPDEWANELHPTPPGFNKLGKKWVPALKDSGLIT